MSKAIPVTVIFDVVQPHFFDGMSVGVAVVVALNDLNSAGIRLEVTGACKGLLDVS